MKCNVCSTEMGRPVYESAVSLTSLCDIFPEPTRVRICANCGHLQTDELADAASFYDADYTILTDSDEEDQIYEVREGDTVYRTEHQLNVFVDKVSVEPGTKILDFGCAKSSMMRSLLASRPGIEPYLYDVSDRYLPFWEKFLEPSRWAIYDLPSDWDGKFDVVTSFFSLEHITQPSDVVAQISRLLKPGGIFYGIVPNVITNSADFIVIDHVNHFTRSSLNCLLTSCGLHVQDIDDSSHRGAFVFVAGRSADGARKAWRPDNAEVDACTQQTGELAEFWDNAGGRVRDFETGLEADDQVSVYGAGFYGAFIRSCLRHPDRIRCVVDQNPYLQGGDLGGAPIVTPDDLPQDVNAMLVGLNPGHARDVIAAVRAFAGRDLTFFYF